MKEKEEIKKISNITSQKAQTSESSLNKGKWWRRDFYWTKDFFTKEWLFDLEKVENKLTVIIEYIKPKTKKNLKELIIDFLNKEVKKYNSNFKEVDFD